MNVYSIVPSHRSHATVSVTISKMIPRNAQMTPPTSSFVSSAFRWASPSPTPRAMKKEREIPEEVALRQVQVALDDAVQPDQLVADDPPARERLRDIPGCRS
jgi:hypothetical protein